MSASEVVVWNATRGVLVIGSNKVVLKPATKASVIHDASIDVLVSTGKLVIVKTLENANVVDDVAAVDEAPKVTTRRRKKIDVDDAFYAQTVMIGHDEQVSTDTQTSESVDNNEPTEDSILAEETF